MNDTPLLDTDGLPDTDDPKSAPLLSESAVSPTIHAPVDSKALALGILATIALVFTLDWAQTFFVPLLLGVLFAYTLNPVVAWLERVSIHRVVGSSVVLLAVVAIIVMGAYLLGGQVQTIIGQLPEAASKLSEEFTQMRDDPHGNMRKMQLAVGEMEKATNQIASIPTNQRQRTTHVVIDTPEFKLGDFMWAGSRGALAYIGQAVMVIFLVFFMLAGGDTFKRKLVKLAGPTLSRKKITVSILNDINHSIQKYMFMLLTTNLLMGVLSWIAYYLLGLENAGAWAVAAGFLHIIPYLGPVVTAGATGMAAFMQFDSLSMGLLIAGTSIALATAVGTFVTTWMTGKIARMNAAAVFISLLFWGWLWGVWGMLLGIPIIVIVKVVSEHIEQMQPVAELLGD